MLVKLSRDFATDVEAGVRFLRNHPRINSRKIWLIGHSEGGYIAAMVAARDRKIEGVVSLAGTAVSGKDVLIEQNRLIRAAQGVGKGTLDWFMPLYAELTDIAIEEDDLEKARLESKEALGRHLSSAPLELRLAGPVLAQEVDAIAHVLRCFDDKDVTHVDDRINPVEDAETIETELMLADIESIEKRMSGLTRSLTIGTL